MGVRSIFDLRRSDDRVRAADHSGENSYSDFVRFTQICSDLVRPKILFGGKKRKGGEKQEGLGSGDGTSDEAWNYLPGKQLPIPSPPVQAVPSSQPR